MKNVILIIAVLCLTSFSNVNTINRATLFPAISAYLQQAETNFISIDEERKAQLKKLATYINQHLQREKQVSLIFICTHNSRRSHMSQLWALAAANYYGINGVYSFSGGTECTAFNPRTVKVLVNSGFQISKITEGSNPNYLVKFGEAMPSITAFSKKYSDSVNPKNNFCAVLTCSDADKNCPIVYGASLRLPIAYRDPKEADDTLNETAVYTERCKQIATEMLYAFSLVKKKYRTNK
jgi:arsenate reductase